MKKQFFSFLIVLFSTLNFLSQTTSPTLTLIATPNSQVGWTYFKDPNTVDPNTLFTLYASNFGLSTDDAMQFVKTETDELGISHTYYNQYYKNIKVDIGQNAAHSRSGNTHLVNGKICTGLNLNVIPAINGANAINYAKSYVNATTYMWEDSLAEQRLKIERNDVNATYYPSSELLITMNGINLTIIPSNFKLAYKVDIYAKVPYISKSIYIDANTGAFIKESSLSHSCLPPSPSPNSCVNTLAHTMYSGDQIILSYFTANPAHGGAFEYKLENPCKGGGILTQLLAFNLDDVYTTSAITWGSGPTFEQLTQLQWATDKYYDFLLATFNRQSIDNNNIQLKTFVSTTGPQYNPPNTLEMKSGYGTNDFIGHEWGHGVTDYAGNGLLNGIGETEAISEGISDVWGTIFEFYLNSGNITNWTIGEEYSVSNGGFRDIASPNSKGMPDTYKWGLYYDNTYSDPHAEGQIAGHWFYLLSQGGTGFNSFNDPNDLGNLNGHNNFNYNVTAIGIAQAAQILYRAYPYLNSGSTYNDLRNATLQAAIDLYGSNCAIQKNVKDAWDAVGVYDKGNSVIGIQSNCIEACVTKTDITCSNAFGTANIFIDPLFTDPYSIDWFKSDFSFNYGNSSSVNNLPVGDYVVNIVNLNNTNCQSFFYFTINDYSNTTLAFTTTNATCTDGTTSVIASGGAYPYTYAWNPSYFNGPAAMISDLPAGTYNVTVTDANGCQATGSTVVAQNPISFYKPFNYDVTTNETWNQALIKIDGQVIVAPGGHLTITGNTRVEISHHTDILDPMPFGVARIIVEPGGNLTIAPTVTLTGCGGGTWDGIELWGTGIFNNGAALGNIQGQIENADIGIFTSRRPKRNQAIVNNYGGSLLVNGAKFINNKVGIYMPRSSSPFSPAQQIKSSTFKIDGTSYYKNDFSLANNVEPIHIFAGNNVYVNASSNTMTGGDQYYSSTLKGTGIKCIDCNLIVNNAIGTTSTFTGLAKGIDNENVFSTNQIVVDGSTFTNNQEAIYMQGSNYAEITNNMFNVPAPVAPFPKAYALFVVNSNGFDVSGNIINPLAANASSYGMVFDDSKSIGGVVFNNTFNGIGVGLQAQNDNSNLKIGCNNFNNPISYSMRVLNITGTASLKQQGVNCNANGNPAGNEWVYSCNTSLSDANVFTDAGVNFNYYSYKANSLNLPYTKPLCSSSLWETACVLPNICNVLQNKDANSCGAIFPLPAAPPSTSYSTYYAAIKNLINTYQIQINVLIPQYKNALEIQDGGNTKNLLDAINLNPNKSAGQLRNLLTSSGALSDVILLAAINRNPALPPGILKEILAKQIPLSFAIIKAIQNSNLPSGIKNEIYAAQGNTPLYIKATTIESEIKYYQGDIVLLESELQRTKLRETKTISKEDLKESIDPSSRMILAQNYATAYQTDSMRLVLNQLVTDTMIALTEKQNFVSYMNAIADMLDSNKTVYNVDTIILANVIPVSISNTKMSAHANVALKERKKPHHHYFIADIPASNNVRLANNNAEGDNDNKTQLSNNGAFKIFPNPNAGNFKIAFDENIQSYFPITISISNLLGQVVFTKTLRSDAQTEMDINTEGLIKGVYIITLMQSNSNIGQSKLIIE